MQADVVTTPSSYMINHRICNTGATSGADITFVVVTTPSSYTIYHRICYTGATSGADITFVVVTIPSSYMICHWICNTGATSGADITYSSGEPGAYLGFLWDSCCSTFSSVYGHNVTSNKTNIRRLHPIVGLELSEYDEEKFVDTKGVTCSRNSRGRQPNGKKKKDHMTNNDIPNTTLKTKY
jgi:hypothetical protein